MGSSHGNNELQPKGSERKAFTEVCLEFNTSERLYATVLFPDDMDMEEAEVLLYEAVEEVVALRMKASQGDATTFDAFLEFRHRLQIRGIDAIHSMKMSASAVEPPMLLQ